MNDSNINTPSDSAKTWIQALDIIAGTIERKAFQTWFKETSGAYIGDTFVITCPTDFAKEWIYSRYANVVLSAVEQATGNDAVKIAFRSLKQPVEAFDKSRVALLND